MRYLILTVAGVALAGVLSGCATLDKAQCEAGDWRSLGMTDGGNGRPLAYIQKHVSACSEHGISVNRQLYEAGREEGLVSYCRIDRAESDGRSGRRNYSSCHGDIGIAFNNVHRAAKNVHNIEQRIEVAETQMDGLLQRITAPGLSDEERLRIKGQISDLQFESDLIEGERRLAERELRHTYNEEERRLGGGFRRPTR